ncbi:MAG: type II toxin-antitoxin system RelE/ParE family toxin [Acidimicrobiales bacterium]
MSTPSRHPYELEIARSVAPALTDALPEKVARAVYAFIVGALLDDPHRVGRPLIAPLTPSYSARRGDYRVLYLIDDGSMTVRVTAVTHRADAFRP